MVQGVHPPPPPPPPPTVHLRTYDMTQKYYVNMNSKERFTFTEWFHQQNKFAASIKNMQGINACLKDYYVPCIPIVGVILKSTTMKAIKPTIPCFEHASSSYFWKQLCFSHYEYGTNNGSLSLICSKYCHFYSSS